MLKFRTKGEFEARISDLMIKFQKEKVGRGAESARTFICHDMIIVRLERALTPIEKTLLQSEEGKKVIKELRVRLSEIVKPELEKLISSISEANVKSVHFDISTKTGEYIYVFIMDRILEFGDGAKGPCRVQLPDNQL
ncbi:Uncharacterized protein YbcI [Caldanaerobius fijiensis DSM 17918]|uniref:Uncharacterized protein YbcI n=1 Tax=Caldanaerobius fijiensis DSM 17918 TaxID=1121256 RepID=A0A1M5FFF8_9THEO|nr:DUF2294 domain-containing protein [Caldanaerobius fijiensis]SHF90226.1 Uncharacterized protein YbcI [Caldanaerobius fijiensis DSM 17918]